MSGYLDLSLTTAVIGLLGKMGWDHYKTRKTNGNGHCLPDSCRLAMIAEREQGVESVTALFDKGLVQVNENLKQGLALSNKTNELLAELVYSNRERQRREPYGGS